VLNVRELHGQYFCSKLLTTNTSFGVEASGASVGAVAHLTEASFPFTKIRSLYTASFGQESHQLSAILGWLKQVIRIWAL